MTHAHALPSSPRAAHGDSVNDTHSGLNRTCVSRVIEPRTVEDVVRTVRRSRSEGRPLAIAGGRHAMGGKQFLLPRMFGTSIRHGRMKPARLRGESAPIEVIDSNASIGCASLSEIQSPNVD